MSAAPILYGVCPYCHERLEPGDECLVLVMSIRRERPSPQYPTGYEMPRLEYIHVRCSREVAREPRQRLDKRA